MCVFIWKSSNSTARIAGEILCHHPHCLIIHHVEQGV